MREGEGVGVEVGVADGAFSTVVVGTGAVWLGWLFRALGTFSNCAKVTPTGLGRIVGVGVGLGVVMLACGVGVGFWVEVGVGVDVFVGVGDDTEAVGTVVGV